MSVKENSFINVASVPIIIFRGEPTGEGITPPIIIVVNKAVEEA